MKQGEREQVPHRQKNNEENKQRRDLQANLQMPKEASRENESSASRKGWN